MLTVSRRLASVLLSLTLAGCAGTSSKLEVSAGVPGIGELTYTSEGAAAKAEGPSCYRITFYDEDGDMCGNPTAGGMPGSVPIPKGARYATVEEIDCSELSTSGHPSDGRGERLEAEFPHLLTIAPVGSLTGEGDLFACVSGLGDLEPAARAIMRGAPLDALPAGVSVHYAFTVYASTRGLLLIIATAEPLARSGLIFNGHKHPIVSAGRFEGWSLAVASIPFSEVRRLEGATNNLGLILDGVTHKGVTLRASYTVLD